MKTIVPRTVIRYRDGSQAYHAVHSTPERPRWRANWADGTPLRGDNDEISYFESSVEAVQALIDGREGPAA